MTTKRVKTGDWDIAKRGLGVFSRDFKRAVAESAVLMREAETLRSLIVTGLVAQAPGFRRLDPPSKWTLAMRRFPSKNSKRSPFSGTKSLIVSGEMMRSAIAKKVGDSRAFVGVNRKTPGGVNIAAVQEFGTRSFAIPFTPKMKKFLAIMARKAGFPRMPKNVTKTKYVGGKSITVSTRPSRSVLIMHIKPRPFLQPSYDMWMVGIGDRVKNETREALKRVSGLSLR